MRRNRSVFIILVIAILLVWQYQQDNEPQLVTFTGSTMGTNYNVKYLSIGAVDYQIEIDSLLQQINQSLSTYIGDSEISRFNQGSSVTFEYPHFPLVMKASREVFDKTEGSFNPAVMPLVNAWGFGPDGHQSPDSAKVDSLVQLVDFLSIEFDDQEVRKTIDGVQLDFSAIAKGYGVDVLAQFLEDRGVEEYLVDIGGEVSCRGANDRGETWRIGINIPYEEAPLDSRAAVVKLQDRSIATSGNYRNYYIKDGVKYAHTIDPVSGYPVEHSLLSASVFHQSCMYADAFATSFMVMGLDRARELVESTPDLEAVLIFSDRSGELSTYMSPGIEEYVTLEGAESNQ